LSQIREEFIGESAEALQVVQQIAQFAEKPDIDVLITGETGTGKEVAARTMHNASSRKNAPFVAENCANFTDVGVSELFGNNRGAFTTAVTQHKGAFERAGHGTLFLDEVQDLSAETQAQLLRAVERRVFRRVGGETELAFNGRIVYATNLDLAEAVRETGFRRDLYHRISAHRIHIPPLRERRDDIIVLAKHLAERHTQRPNTRLSQTVAMLFTEYDFPGNVRELDNIIKAALLHCTGDELVVRHVLPHMHWDAEGTEQEPAKETESDAGAEDAKAAWRSLYSSTLKEAMSQLEKEYCREFLPWVLKFCNNNLSQAAKEAGVDPKTFRRKWKECGLGKLSTR